MKAVYQQILFAIISVLGFCLLLASCEFIYKKGYMSAEYTRKLAHTIATLASLSFVFLFSSHWYLLIVAVIFVVLLYAAKRSSWLSSINNVERQTTGAMLIPLGIYLPFLAADLFNNILLFILPVLILAICDPLAWLFGSKYAKSKNHFLEVKFNKTFLGSGIFFISAFVLSVVVFFLFEYPWDKIILLSFILALSTCLIEIISPRGTDNLSIPIIAILILTIYTHLFA